MRELKLSSYARHTHDWCAFVRKLLWLWIEVEKNVATPPAHPHHINRYSTCTVRFCYNTLYLSNLIPVPVRYLNTGSRNRSIRPPPVVRRLGGLLLGGRLVGKSPFFCPKT
jgi:hypothetical protein